MYFDKDIDECETGICGNNSKCTNRPGSYSCECLVGFEEDKVTKECSGIPFDFCLNRKLFEKR